MSTAALSGLFFDPLAASHTVLPTAAAVAVPAAQSEPAQAAPPALASVAPAPELRGGQQPSLTRRPEKTHRPENRAASLQEVRRDLERLSRRRAASQRL